jgi:hypothetical protein
MKKSFGQVFAVAAAVAALAGAGPAAGADGWSVVAHGLDNPRGLSLAPFAGSWHGRDSGALYVAEAGRGGTGPCGIAGNFELNCYGPTGAITKITPAGQRRVVTGLPSLANATGTTVTGPHDVAILGGRAYIAIGCGCTLATRAVFGPAGAPLGTLVRAFLGNGMWRSVADLTAYEDAFNPDGADVNANPYAALAQTGRRYVIDAGGNDLFAVHRRMLGPSLQLLSVFPPRLALAPPFLGLPPGTMIPMQSVPDSIVRGPDGAFYVGELTGFPFPVGGARVYRLDPHAVGPPQIYATGFTNIIDIAFDENGTLYVLEHRKFGLLGPNTTGALIRVGPGNAQTEIASTGLVNPTGLAISGGLAFVSNFGTSAAIGEVVAIPLH